MCRATFVKIYDVDPAFDLSPPEAGFTIPDTGDLCPACRFVFKELMTEYKGDWEKVMTHVRVRRQILSEKKPRLAVIDIGLPDIDGRAFSSELKKAPDTASMLVLQVSASFVTQADMVSSLEQGADASLVEPIDPSVLLATVRWKLLISSNSAFFAAES